MENLEHDIKKRLRNGEGATPLSIEAQEQLALGTLTDLRNQCLRAEVPLDGGFEGFIRAARTLDEIQEGVGQEKLERLAIKIVQEELNISSKELRLDAKLLSPLDPPLFVPKSEPVPNEGETKSFENFKAEVDKRRVTNQIIQGGSHVTQMSFLMHRRELDELDPRLSQACKSFMITADTGIWYIDENAPPLHEQQVGGLIELDLSTKPITVIARAMHFPILVHELMKGALEAIALWGLPGAEVTDPKEKAQFKKLRDLVFRAADRLEYEGWDMRIGGELWKRLMSTIPKERLSERASLLQELFRLPAKEFNSLMEAIGSGNLEPVKRFFERV